MVKKLITPSRTLGYSALYLDFLAGKDSIQKFFRAVDIAEVSRQLDARDYPRQTMVSILEKQNQAFRASELTMKNIARLKEPNSVCVFAGQQAVLFGGPLLVVLKALAAIKTAKSYEKQLGRPVIPIFWIAGDDHDFAEANHTYLLDRQSEEVRVTYEAEPPYELPASQIQIENKKELEQCVNELMNTLGQTDFTEDLFKLIEDAYTSEDTLVTAYGKFMAAITRDYGLVLFNPGDAEVKRLAIPFFHDLLDKQNDLQQLVTKTNNEIQNLGYHLQVKKKENAAFFFYNDNGRTPVIRDGDEFQAGELIFSREEINKLLDSYPERFSPDAKTRPVMQSSLFPVLCQFGGPSELAYLAQVNPLFELFDVIPPVYRSRPSATVLENRYQKIMDELQIDFEELTGDVEQVVNRVMKRSFPEDIEDKFHGLREKVKDEFNKFSEESLKFDPSLEKNAEQIFARIDYNLKAFENKLFSSHKKKSTQTRERIYRVWHALYPNRDFQDRSLNVNFFLARYGMKFMQFLYDSLDCEETSHQIIFLSEYEA